ncbi:MAG TPA: nucleoside deaminase [Candidatus Magasanikbacteria bacterium]|nr:nucleoside deaminase [Candidatus Magasanikbacteria bacterium]
MNIDKKFLKQAVKQAELSLQKGGFPAGAVLVKDGKVISRGVSLGGILHDPTEHSETSSIKKACKKLKTTDLSGCTLYASLEPCLMCFSVANWSGVSKIVYGCRKTQHMIGMGCYEGENSSTEINKLNRRKITIEYLGDFEVDSLRLVGDWEKGLVK